MRDEEGFGGDVQVLIVVIQSWMYTYVKLVKLYTNIQYIVRQLYLGKSVKR